MRTRNGRHRYVQLVEAYREGGRTRQRVIASLGREDQLDSEKLRRLARQLVAWAEGRQDVEPSDVEVGASREIGRLMVLEAEQLHGRHFAFDVATVIKAIVFGRVIEPSSERALVREWLRRVRWPGFEAIRLHHTYRALATLADIQVGLERALTQVLTGRLFADVSLTLFGTTSIHFEGHGPKGLASHGYSPTGPDLVQVRLGLLTGREGLPLSHWVFPGDQSDGVSFAEAARHFRTQLPVGDFTVVGDRGMVNGENLKALEQAQVPSMVGVRLRRHAARQTLASAGRYRQVKPNLFVEVDPIHDDGVFQEGEPTFHAGLTFGLLVPRKSPEVLARAMLRLTALPPEVRRAMGRAGRGLVEGNYSVERVVDRWEALYKELLESKGVCI